jgi:rhodanese-related sulfurtransferase
MQWWVIVLLIVVVLLVALGRPVRRWLRRTPAQRIDLFHATVTAVRHPHIPHISTDELAVLMQTHTLIRAPPDWSYGTPNGKTDATASVAGASASAAPSPAAARGRLLLLDVRDPMEFMASHLEGAHHVSCTVTLHDDDRQRAVQLVLSHATRTGPPLVVACYCSVGLRSASLATALLSDERLTPLMAGPRTAGPSLPASDSAAAAAGASPAASEPAPPLTVLNVRGSLFQWANEARGGMCDHKGRATTRVHPFGVLWAPCLRPEVRAPLGPLPLDGCVKTSAEMERIRQAERELADE